MFRCILMRRILILFANICNSTISNSYSNRKSDKNFFFLFQSMNADGEIPSDIVSAWTRSRSTTWTRSRYGTTKRRPDLQYPTATCGRLLSIQYSPSRWSLQSKLRRGGCPVCKYAQLCGFLQWGKHQQPGTRVPQVSQRGHLWLWCRKFDASAALSSSLLFFLFILRVFDFFKFIQPRIRSLYLFPWCGLFLIFTVCYLPSACKLDLLHSSIYSLNEFFLFLFKRLTFYCRVCRCIFSLYVNSFKLKIYMLVVQ